MTNLTEALENYRASLSCQEIVDDLLNKSRKGTVFHNTICFNKSLDQARALLVQAKTEIADFSVVSLISVFERIVFNHPESPLRSKVHRKRSSGLNDAILHFKTQVSPRVYDDVNRLCEYRDWVAHGRRWEKPCEADPVNTYQCLIQFLEQAGIQSNR